MYKVNLMLADSAQCYDGKLSVLGGGWSFIIPGGPFAVAGIIDIPWSEATSWHTFRLELIDADGEPFCVQQQPDEEPKPLAIDSPPYRPNIAPHVKPGMSLGWAFAVNVPPGLPLEPGKIYEWRPFIDGHNDEGWSLPFSVLPTQPLQQAA